ncbi:ORC-CDC6 family AAA ATPase [Tautonia sociabilis]|uniref:Uncharacterized protein n=1 Tax=Tautonia sociabilis TaxID=2080755 RepID=A0A432MQP9_9BACT|nr:hypothetical protein [Tautonia sociabilis]RUL89467.1 hypothetical protein TsocGM_01455 [Tautonia sociabilis]
MKTPRNPFRLRRSESIDSEATFLSLFEPGILDILPADAWKERVQVIRSAAGGGKTSLMRLFVPGALQTLHAMQMHRTDEQIGELFQKLKELGAIDEGGPKLLGVSLLCGRGYSRLDDLPLDEARKDRLFFGLLNARIVLAVLHNVAAAKKLDFPAGLQRVQVAAPEPPLTIPALGLPCNGLQLFEWARDLEHKVCSSLDSFGPLRVDSLPGHDALLGLALIRADMLRLDGAPVADHVLLMMDDIQQLTPTQRERLVESVIEARSPVGVWIAERFEALNTRDMLASGTNEGRDYNEPISIEKYWRPKHSRFEKLAIKIADRRVRYAADSEINSFRACVQDSLDIPRYEPVFARACEEIESRIRARVGASRRYGGWIDARQQAQGTPRERAIGWRSLEVLIERELRRPQKSLFDDLLEEGELEQKDDSSVRNAAELFLAREYGLPYYFGPECIARLASLNIKQFLGLAGDIFEESAASELLKKGAALSPDRQHKLMKRAAQAVWDDIPNGVAMGRELRNFLDAVGKFSRWYTYRPTAPNDPGVGGTALRMSERAMLMDEGHLRSRPDHKRFADILASALAHNLLVADLDYRCKGENWIVLNLNRLLCVHFDLPLNYGLYKERPLQQLVGWIDRPFVEPKSEGSLL